MNDILMCLGYKFLSVTHLVAMVLLTSIIKGNVGLDFARTILCFVCVYSTFLAETLKVTDL